MTIRKLMRGRGASDGRNAGAGADVLVLSQTYAPPCPRSPHVLNSRAGELVPHRPCVAGPKPVPNRLSHPHGWGGWLLHIQQALLGALVLFLLGLLEGDGRRRHLHLGAGEQVFNGQDLDARVVLVPPR